MSGAAMVAQGKRLTRAVVCQGGGMTALQSCPVPDPGEGELLLRLRLAGLCSTDLIKLSTNGALPGTVLGHELVGTVEAIGPGMEDFALGERVVAAPRVACGVCAFCRAGNETMCEAFKENLMYPGAYSDLVLISRRAVEEAAFVLPDHVSDEQGVFIEPAACVLRGIERSGLGRRGTVAVLGCGTMGLLHLMVLRAAFPGARVVMVDPDVERLEMAKRLGADGVGVPGPGVEIVVQELAGGLGADVVFDTVGGASALEEGIGLARAGGTVVLFSHAPEHTAASFDLNSLFTQERRVIGTYNSALKEQVQVFELICKGELDPAPLVTHSYGLEDFGMGAAFAKRQKALKVVFTPSQGAAHGGNSYE